MSEYRRYGGSREEVAYTDIPHVTTLLLKKTDLTSMECCNSLTATPENRFVCIFQTLFLCVCVCVCVCDMYV